ncbi:MAG: uracil-DNA glycosylase [Chloroflexota bacterium]
MHQTILDSLIDFESPGLFNQYTSFDPAHDVLDAHLMRQKNLIEYLEIIDDPALILLAEAAGYRGCRFSGIPMTSENHLVGSTQLDWAKNGSFRKTSVKDVPWREPSATILYQVIQSRTDILIWNTVPWHPMGKRGALSNRPPRRAEIDAGLTVLQNITVRYPSAKVVAVGRVAERSLRAINLDTVYVRHPAHGGKPEFERGLLALLDD